MRFIGRAGFTIALSVSLCAVSSISASLGVDKTAIAASNRAIGSKGHGSHQPSLVEGNPADLLTKEVQSALGLKCEPAGLNTSHEMLVVELLPNSEAVRAGIQQGDKILDARIVEDRIEMSIMRAGQTHLVKLPQGAAEAALAHAPAVKAGMHGSNNSARKINSNAITTANTATSSSSGPFAGNASQTASSGSSASGSAGASLRLARPISSVPDTTFGATSTGPIPLRVEKIESGATPQATGLPPVAPSFAKLDGGTRSNQAFPLSVQKAGLAGSAQQKPVMLVGQASQTGVRILQNYNVELVIDASMSMRRPDCPGYTSRWNWCGMQAHELANEVSPFLPRGVTITTFASQYDVYENANPQRVSTIFSRQQLQLGTRMAAPLQERLNSYFARRTPGSKPLLICIITDGAPAPPSEADLVTNVLINATKRMHNPTEITVIFFQIGGRARKGREFLAGMDHGLVSAGAKYDIVKTVSFEHLVNRGLARSISDTVRTHTQ